jgi:hypothetical protein
MIAKCANPACPTRFEHRLGGKFFRFRREPSSQGEVEGFAGARSPSHNVEHFWLCARCCQVFTLVYVEGQGVVLRLSRVELSADASREILTAA